MLVKLMEEESLLIVKPDAVGRSEVINFIFGELLQNGLSIVLEKTIYLNKSLVDRLWPKLKDEDVLLDVFSYFLTQGNSMLIFVKGVDAIKKTNDIKTKTRLLYAIDAINNCVHTPTNEQEYFFNRQLLLNYKENKDVLKVSEKARKIIGNIEDVGFPYIFYTCNKYVLYLLNDEKHWIGELIDSLENSIKSRTVAISVAILLGQRIKQICISCSDDLNKLARIQKN